MRKTLTTLLATTAFVVAGSAIAADATYKSETTVKKSDDGSYKKESNVESKDAAGKSSATVKQEKDVDSDGDSSRTTTVEKVNDPKGLMNKKTDKVKETVKVKDGKTKVETKHTVDGTTVEDKTATY
ncbi:MAG: hypothetical protein ACOYNL_10635 [Rickettsiales bacterium]